MGLLSGNLYFGQENVIPIIYLPNLSSDREFAKKFRI